MQCSLCLHEKLQKYHWDEKRSWQYYICENCDFVFRDPVTYLEPQEEEYRYSTHNNSIENQGYVRFLSPAVEMLLPYLKESSRGLDFGSGPGPIIDKLFEPHGIQVENYDPYFSSKPELLKQQYDFITCTEVFEHFYQPSESMGQICQLLKPGAYLSLMTEFRQDLQHFKTWPYRLDNTHVCFLNNRSLQWLCSNCGFDLLESDGRRLVLLQKL